MCIGMCGGRRRVRGIRFPASKQEEDTEGTVSGLCQLVWDEIHLAQESRFGFWEPMACVITVTSGTYLIKFAGTTTTFLPLPGTPINLSPQPFSLSLSL